MKQHALITILKDENIMLPIFLRHYRQTFEDSDIYILDNDSTDGCIEKNVPSGVNVEVAHSQYAFDHLFAVNSMNKLKKKLLNDYHTVMHADIDEIVVPDPTKFKNLESFLKYNTETAVTTTGYDIYHSLGEPDLKWNEFPILSQRKYWIFNKNLCKPLILRYNLDWCVGHHALAAEYNAVPNKDLYMLHLHKADWKTCVSETERKRSYNWEPNEILNNRGFQNRLEDKHLEHWFRLNDTKKTKYPDWVKGVL